MSNEAILASFAWQVAYCLAAPTPNTTVTPDAEPGWRKEPKGRGTFSIILTSVLTLGLCVWTAIHPNVKPNASCWQKVKQRLFFVVLGMLAPELVLAVAFDEWREARTFHREWCELYGIEPGSEQDTLRMKGAFFVTMGGVSMAPAYKVPAGIPNILSTNAYLRLARTNTRGKELNMEEFKDLMQGTAHTAVEPARREEAVELLELDPDLPEREGERRSLIAPQARSEPPELGQAKKNDSEGSEEEEQEQEQEQEMIIKREFVHYREVQDKGKAEMLGKTLVCVQALWMLVQCVVRKASGLPVTLLEIHVAMHVICAIGVYSFWFNKPQDVGEPVPISISSDPEQLYVEIAGGNRLYQGHGLLISMEGDKYHDTLLDRVQPLPTTKSVHFPGQWREDLAESQRWARAVARLSTPADVVDPAHLIITKGRTLDLGPVLIYHVADLYRTCVMPSEDLDFFKRAVKAYGAGKRPKLPRVHLLRHVSVGNVGDILEDIYASNIFPAIFILLAYGACHAAAWNTHFPSPIERLLWRISSVVMAVAPAYALFLLALTKSGYDILVHVLTFNAGPVVKFMGLEGYREDRLGFWWRLCSVLLEIWMVIWLVVEYLCGFVLCTIVPISRSYLILESFLSLRSLPYGSFDSTPWEDYLPHF